MGEISAGTKWLLDFANLRREKGVLNPPGEAAFERLKRKPELKIEKIVSQPGESFVHVQDADGFVWLTDPVYIEQLKELKDLEAARVKGLIKDDDFVWPTDPDREPMFRGKVSSAFSLDIFKKWILKVGIPPYKPADEIFVEEMEHSPLALDTFKIKTHTLDLRKSTEADKRVEELLSMHHWFVRLALNWVTEGGKPIGHVCRYLKIARFNLLTPDVNFETGKPVFEYSCVLPQAIVAYFLDFWVNQKELHEPLRECPTCGTFFFMTKEHKTYCSKECRKKFGQDAREDEARRQQAKRDKDKDKKEEERKKAEKLRLQLENQKKYREEESWKQREAKKYWDNLKKDGYQDDNIRVTIQNYLYGRNLSYEQFHKITHRRN